MIVELEGTEGDKEVPGDCLTDARLNASCAAGGPTLYHDSDCLTSGKVGKF